MSKCRVCGEEYGNNLICSVCGTPKPVDEVDSVEKKHNDFNSQDAKLRMIEESKKSVCKVIVQLSDGSGCHGTGWCGAKNLIITNAHVVDTESDKVTITNLVCEFSKDLKIRSHMIPMKVLFMSTNEDIAILGPLKGQLPEEIKPFEISPEDARLGEEVFTIGNPLHYNFTLMNGVVSNPDYVREGKTGIYNSLQTTLTLNGGNSGGAVFNLEGKVVGMATYYELKSSVDEVALQTEVGVINGVLYKNDRIDGYGFCVKSEAILACIDRVLLN